MLTKNQNKDINIFKGLDSVIIEPEGECHSRSMIENNFISDQCDTPHNIQSNTRCVIETKDHFCINFSSKLEKECLKNQATKEKSK